MKEALYYETLGNSRSLFSELNAIQVGSNVVKMLLMVTTTLNKANFTVHLKERYFKLDYRRDALAYHNIWNHSIA